MHIHPSSPNSSSSLQSEEESAAIKIQAGFRGYRVRKQLHRHQSSRSRNINGYRGPHRSGSYRRHQQNMDVQNSSAAQLRDNRSADSSDANASSIEDQCATKIQAGVRGFLVRKKQKIATDAATKIQAGFRGFKVRKEASQKLKQK